jgi:hypothetical protein
MLQTVSGEALAKIKEVFLTLTLGQHPLKICVFIANITKGFILGLDILCAHNAPVDLRHQMLGIAMVPQVGASGFQLVVENDQEVYISHRKAMSH